MRLKSKTCVGVRADEQRLGGGDVPSIAIPYTPDQARALAVELNRVYGISD